MLSIEEIKKAVQFADGYRTSKIKTCNIDTISTPFVDLRRIDYWVNENSGDYSLLLVRVIEGTNKTRTDLIIEQDDHFITVISDKETPCSFESHKKFGFSSGIDQAKEQAIKHILEQR